MALRNVVVTNPATETQRKLRRIVISEDAIETHWVVQYPDGTRKEERVEVTRARAANIFSRATLQAVIDNIRDDTINRVP